MKVPRRILKKIALKVSFYVTVLAMLVNISSPALYAVALAVESKEAPKEVVEEPKEEPKEEAEEEEEVNPPEADDSEESEEEAEKPNEEEAEKSEGNEEDPASEEGVVDEGGGEEGSPSAEALEDKENSSENEQNGQADQSGAEEDANSEEEIIEPINEIGNTEQESSNDESEDEKEIGKWEENKDGSMSIIVEEGEEYEYKDSGFKIEFKEIEDGTGEITVEEIELTDEQVKRLGALSNKAWDITSDMENGTFEYELTLPNEEEVDEDEVKVVYVEDKDDLDDEEKIKEVDKEDVKVDKDKKEIKADDLDHFTVFVVKWNFPNNPDDNKADDGSNLNKNIKEISGNDVEVSYNYSGDSTNSARATGWDNGKDLKYWMIEFDSTGYENLKLSSKQRSSNTGPGDFRLEYKIGNGDWNTLNETIEVEDNYNKGKISNKSLPLDCDNQENVFIRWIMDSNDSVGGGSVQGSGASNIDDIVIEGKTISLRNGGSGAIWTTRNDCGNNQQNVNHYNRGENVYINGENFSPDTEYYWEVTGQPGQASCDPGVSVASGNYTTDSNGDFCFDAYVVASDDCGEYKVGFDNKNDNYRVNGICGDNYVDSGEECDDGNNADGDGCSSECINEEAYFNLAVCYEGKLGEYAQHARFGYYAKSLSPFALVQENKVTNNGDIPTFEGVNVGENTPRVWSENNYELNNNNYVWTVKIDGKTKTTTIDKINGNNSIVTENNQCPYEKPGPFCGDGIVNDEGEKCDYGEMNGEDGSNCSDKCEWVGGCREEMLTNGSFEVPEVDHDLDWNIFESHQVPGWTAEWINGSGNDKAPQIEIHENALGGAFDGDQYIELDSDWDGPGGSTNGEKASIKIYQEIPVMEGYEYELTWDYSARPNHNNNRLSVEIDDDEVFDSGNISGGNGINWQTETKKFTADEDGLVKISFSEMGTPDSFGMFLDNVRVECLGTETPEYQCNETMYAVNNSSDIFWYDFDENSSKKLDEIDFGSSASADDPFNARTYYISRYLKSFLKYYDHDSKTSVDVGETDIESSFFTKLAFDRYGNLYGLTDDHKLYELNTSDGEATLLGTISGIATGGDIIFDQNNTLYLIGTDGKLFTVNLSTLEATLIRATGLNPVTGMAYIKGYFYVSNGSSYVYKMDKNGENIVTITDERQELINDLSSCLPGVSAECGDGIKNGQEECDGMDGVTEGKNFCSQSCQLVPIYNGQNECPKGTVKSEKPLISKTISGTDVDGETFDLNGNGKYLFEASGFYVPTSPSGWYADAGYTTTNSWSSVSSQYGIQGTGNDYGAHALLADLGDGVGIVKWGEYNSEHIYQKYYEPTSEEIQFVIGDRYDDWFETPWQNQSGMNDNNGSLNLDIYECVENATVEICKEDEEGNRLSDWEMILSSGPVDSKDINVSDSSGTDSDNLSAGEYLIKVSGTYRYGNSQMMADAGFSYRPMNIPSGCDCWLSGFDLSGGSDGLMAWIEENPVDWGFYNENHEYLYVHNHTNDGQPINISIWDNYYDDNLNNGNFQFEIYEIERKGMTGSEGCVVFENIPFGEYYLDEILKEYWINESGTGLVTVDELKEQFVVVNEDHTPYCGDGKVNQENEECDSDAGVGEEEFCTSQCKLIPVYDGDHRCPRGMMEKHIEKISLNSRNNISQYFSNPLIGGNKYLLKASGTYNYANQSQRKADAAYGTTDNFATWRPDIGIWGTNRGVTSIIGDLGRGMGVIEWDDDENINGDHIYSKLIQPNSDLNPEFVISDWYEDWYGNNCDGQSCMNDNSGSLDLNLYQCVDPGSITIIKDTGSVNAHWLDFGFNSNVGEYESFVLNGGDDPTTNSRTFENLYPGEYVFTETDAPGNWDLTGLTCDSENVVIDKDNKKVTVTLSDSGENVECTFTNERRGQVQITKYEDLNGNGMEDEEEPRLEGWQMFLYESDGNDSWIQIQPREVRTDVNGMANYTSLMPKDYLVCEENREAWMNTQPGEEGMIEYDGKICQQVTVGYGDNVPVIFGNKLNPVVIDAKKVVCEDEKYLPNWGRGNGPTVIGENTAEDYVSMINREVGEEVCGLENMWHFQWGPAGAGSNGDFQKDTSLLGDPWTTFIPGNPAMIYDLSNIGNRIEVREEFTYGPMVGFSNSNDNLSAEFYCADDVYNYDNWEWINNPQYGETYHCVGFNALANPEIDIDKTGPEFAKAGESITYNYTVINSGDVPLSSVSVVDDKCSLVNYVGGDSNSNNKLDLDEIWNYDCVVTPTWTFNTELENTATAEGYFGEIKTEATDKYKLYSFILRKDVKTSEQKGFDDPNTLFDVEVKSGDNKLGDIQISESNPAKMWVAEGSYQFCEINVPDKYTPHYPEGCLTFNTGDYPDWTHINYLKPVKIVAHKIVCESEEDLPNWGAVKKNGNPIMENTASEYIAEASGRCWLEEDWQFEYGPKNSGYMGDDFVGVADNGKYQTSNFTNGDGKVEMEITDLSTFNGRIEMREVLKENYLPFTYATEGNKNTNNVSAEFYCGDDVMNYDNWEWINNPQYGETYHCVAWNVEFGEVVVHKFEDENADGQHDNSEQFLADWEMNIVGDEEYSKNTDDNGKASFLLLPGKYNLSETMQEDWMQSGMYCEGQGEGVMINQPGEAYGHHGACSGWNGCGNAETCAQWACEIEGYSNLVSYGDAKPCDQLNKCNLFNNRLSLDRNWYNRPGCPVMGVTDVVCSNGISDRISDEASVEIKFEREDYNSLNLEVKSGDYINCYVGNFQQSEMTISKDNDGYEDGAEEPGDLVTYTIEVQALGNAVRNAVVTDLPPETFEYVAGSWTAHSSAHGNINIPEPTYASPGDWELGDMEKDEVITLTYQARVGEETKTGVYPDLAWAQGENLTSEKLIALSADSDFSVNQGVVDENFVGTQIEVENPEAPPTVKVRADKDEVIEEVEEEVKVLGAAFPATGASNNWLLTALIGMLAGGLMIGLGYLIKNRRKMKIGKIFGLLLGVVLSGFLAGNVLAAGLSVRVSEPDDKITKAFDLEFVAMNIQDRELTAKCQKKSPSDAGFVQFGADISLKAGGDSDLCPVDSSVLSGNGNYEFRVLIVADGGEEKISNTVTTYYDGVGPRKPEYIEKKDEDGCSNEIKFKTANDGQTAYVEIYRSQHTRDIVANNDSLRKTIVIGPNKTHTFRDGTLATGCGDNYFYAIRAFDDAGNASGVREEVFEEIVEEKEIVEIVENPEEVVLNLETGEDVEGEGETAEGEGSEEEAENAEPIIDEGAQTEGAENETDVLGEQDNAGMNWLGDWRAWLVIVLIAGAGWFVYNKRKEK